MTQLRTLCFVVCFLGSAAVVGCSQPLPSDSSPGASAAAQDDAPDSPGVPSRHSSDERLASGESRTESHHTMPARAGAGSERPDAVDTVVGLLLARHTEDLPSRATLNQTRGARAALLWIAQNDPRLIVQGRALEALSLWPDDSSLRYLLSAAQETKSPAKIRASAWRALAAWDLEEHAELKAAATAAAMDPSVPVAYAAAQLLAQ